MKTISPPEDIWSQFALSIFKLNDLLMRAGEGITAPLGQSSARWQVLGRVAFESQTVASMARNMGHARQSVQRVADALVKEGLIAYKHHPTDRRTQLLELTPPGLEVLKAIYGRQMQWSEQVLTKLKPEQLAILAQTLEEVGQTLEIEVNASDRGD